MNFRYNAVLLVFVVFAASSFCCQANDNASVNIKFCAPENDVYPFFISQGDSITGINPGIMNQVITKEKFPNVTLQYVKRPWKRCNTDLENGEVDMMIGGYDPDRRDVVYPLKLGFNLNDTSVSTANVCFSSIKGKQMDKTRLGMQGLSSFIVGIEAGFSKKHPDGIKPRWVVLFNPIEKYRMLEKGRIDAIVQVCAMDGTYPIETKAEATGYTNFETMYPPYLSNPAYVVFSENFALLHNELAKKIIVKARSVDKERVYSRYKPKD